MNENLYRLCTAHILFALRLLDEEEPYISAQSKSHIKKTMCLAAVARPRFLVDPAKCFDGKLGIWPFIEFIPDARTSKNRAKGTLSR